MKIDVIELGEYLPDRSTLGNVSSVGPTIRAHDKRTKVGAIVLRDGVFVVDWKGREVCIPVVRVKAFWAAEGELEAHLYDEPVDEHPPPPRKRGRPPKKAQK